MQDQCPYNDACSSDADCGNSLCDRLLVCNQAGPKNGGRCIAYDLGPYGDGKTLTNSEIEEEKGKQEEKEEEEEKEKEQEKEEEKKEEQAVSFNMKKVKKFGPFQISVDVDIEPRSRSKWNVHLKYFIVLNKYAWLNTLKFNCVAFLNVYIVIAYHLTHTAYSY